MLIGKIVSASSHVEYLCQVYGPGETETPPQPHDYGFGTFVSVQQGDGENLVGVISNTQLVNPEFGNLGPRLSSQDELAIFSPDYLNEKVVLVSVTVLGAMGSGGALQGVPTVAANIDAQVRCMEEDKVVTFHQSSQGLRLAYLPLLVAMNNPLAPQLALGVIDRLSRLFPEETPRLAILGCNLAWKSRVEPVG